jgi:hypothetical protein
MEVRRIMGCGEENPPNTTRFPGPRREGGECDGKAARHVKPEPPNLRVTPSGLQTPSDSRAQLAGETALGLKSKRPGWFSRAGSACDARSAAAAIGLPIVDMTAATPDEGGKEEARRWHGESCPRGAGQASLHALTRPPIGLQRGGITGLQCMRYHPMTSPGGDALLH